MKLKMTHNELKKNDKEAPLFQHFLELRKRLMYCAFAVIVLSFGAYFLRIPLLNFLIHPLYEAMQQTSATNRLIYTGVAEGFIISFKISLLSGFILSLPFIGYQIYQFVVHALFPHEKRAFLYFIIGTPILFLVGCLFSYFVVLPLSYVFFLDYQTLNTLLPIELEAKVSEYISLTLHLMMAFGLAFELPLVLLLLGKVGIITSQSLISHRRIMIIIIFVIAAVLTPPDVISQIALAIPLLLLYELSIFMLRRREKLCMI